MTRPITIVAISGSLRRDSSNAAMLRAAAAVAPEGARVVAYDALAGLPPFNPDLDEEGCATPAVVGTLRQSIIAADAVVIASPEYAHGIPGSLKNMLDWLVSTGELTGKLVSLLNASASGGQYAQAQLAETLRTMNWSVVEEASLKEPFITRRIRDDLDEPTALDRLRAAMAALVDAVERLRDAS